MCIAHPKIEKCFQAIPENMCLFPGFPTCLSISGLLNMCIYSMYIYIWSGLYIVVGPKTDQNDRSHIQSG